MVDDSDERDRTLWCGNLDDRVTDEMLYELFIQAGPLEKVRIATDRDTQKKKGFAFVTFRHVCSVPYTIDLMSGMQLFDRNLRLQTRPGSIHESANQSMGSSPHLQATPPHFMQRSFSAPGAKQANMNSPQGYYEPESPDFSGRERERDRDHRREGGHNRRPSYEDRGHRDRSSDRDRSRDRGRDRDRDRDDRRDDRERGGDRDFRDRGGRSAMNRVQSEPINMPPSLVGMGQMGQFTAAQHMMPQQRHRGSSRDRHAAMSPPDAAFLLSQVNQLADRYVSQQQQQGGSRHGQGYGNRQGGFRGNY